MKIFDFGLVHPFMFGLFPILLIYINNIAEISLKSLIIPILVIFGITIFIILCILKISKTLKKSTLTVSFLLLLFFSIGYVQLWLRGYDVFGFRADSLTILFIPYIFTLFFGIYAIYRIHDVTKLTKIISVISIAVILSFVPSAIINSVGLIDSNYFFEDIKFRSDIQPDIYFIVLDGYTGTNSLKNDFEFDNSQFLQSLYDFEFYTPEKHFSNYGWSNLSMASILNMDYIHKYPNYSVNDSLLLRNLFNNNLVMNTFQSNGYQTFFIDGGAPFRNMYSSEFTLCHDVDNGLLQNLIDTSMISIISKWFLVTSWDEIRTCAFMELENVHKQSDKPKFVYAHINLPHHPYSYDSNLDLIEYFEIDEELNEKVSNERYIYQLQYANKKILELIPKLISSSENKLIIIISDHGWAFTHHFKQPLENNEQYLIQRYDNFQAFYLPQNEKSYNYITPVNIFRTIFNDFFNTDLELVENMAIFVEKDPVTSTYLYQVDVTNIVAP
jgi:hypothetical protein